MWRLHCFVEDLRLLSYVEELRVLSFVEDFWVLCLVKDLRVLNTSEYTHPGKDQLGSTCTSLDQHLICLDYS